MKKFILIILVMFSASWFFALHAQINETPSDGAWKHQPTKIETWLYNAAFFDFEIGSGSETDSIPETTTEFEYGTDMITSLTSAWINAEWMMQIKTEIYIKNEAEVDSMVMSMYDTVTTQWKRNTKIVNEFEGEAQSETRIYSADSLTGEWKLFSQTDYEYNSSGFKTTDIMSTFSADSGRLVTTSKTEYYVDTNGRVDSTKNFFKVPVQNMWQATSQTNFYYNNDGTTDYQVTYSWSFLTQSWSKTSQTTYAYTAEGNQYLQAQYNWESSQQDWLLNSKDSTIFSSNSSPLVQINMQKPFLENELYVYQKTYFTYGTPSSIPRPVKETNVVVYPNPTSDFLNISTNSFAKNHIRLFDLNGKIIFEKSVVTDKMQIPVKNFNKGSYLLQVSSPEGVDSKIIVIQ